MSAARPARARIVRLAAAALVALAVSACAPEAGDAQDAADRALEARVTAAIDGASDLPDDAFFVAARNGIVTITGSVACEECGGMLTPGGIQSVQQTLGAVVRAVPGVERVEFELEYQL